MVFLSSLVHALRESAQRAIAHVRPPGPVKHGGTAGPWKQHVRPLSSSPTAHTHTQHDPSYTFQQHIVRLSQPSAKDPLRTFLKEIRKHAMQPVFRGFKTQSPFAGLGGSNYRRKPEDKTPQRSPKRPILGTVADVGLNLYKKKFSPGVDVIWAPALGLRAALDELQDELKSHGRPVKRNTTLHNAVPVRAHRHGSATRQRKPVDFFERTPQSEADINWDDMDSISFSLDSDYCESCSSSYVEGVVSPPESMQGAEGEASNTFAEADQVPLLYTTTLRIPMSPDLFRILAGNVRDGDIFDALDYPGRIQNIVDDYHDFRLNVLLPLERGLRDGHLSQLDPHGWNAGQLFLDPENDIVCCPIRFFNRTREEVLAMLRLDVRARLYAILQHFVTDDTGMHQDLFGRHRAETDDGEMVHEEDNSSSVSEGNDLTVEEDQQHGVGDGGNGSQTPTERSRSTVDVADALAHLGRVSIWSMNAQHNSPPVSPDLLSVHAAGDNDVQFPILDEMEPNDSFVMPHPVF